LHFIKNALKYIYYGVNNFIFSLLCFIKKAENKPIEGNILIIISDGLGDNIVRIELLRRYVDFFSNKNLTFLIEETSGVNELLDLVIGKNLHYLYFSSTKWLRNPFYRFNYISKLYKYNFSEIALLFTIPNRTAMPFIRSFNTHKTYYYHTNDITRYSLLDDILLYNQITGDNVPINNLTANLKQIIVNIPVPILNIPNEYIVVGIGASLYGRRYSIESFITILEWLIFNNYKIVFLGKGDTDSQYLGTLMKCSPIIKSNSTNFINKLSFKDSLQVLNMAKLFIGVESGLFNAANFLDVPLLVIYGGGHYGRFKHERENALYMSNKMPCFGCNWSNCPFGNLKHQSAKCISSITPESIINGLKMLLDKID
jgi:ADP-heptose:LPS heptosyltransferase